MIVVGGEALVDLVIDSNGAVTAKLGGGPFNTARTIARLGSHVALFASLSNDRFGTLLHQQLLDDGVDDSLLQFTELPTTIAAAELDEGGSAAYRFYVTDTSAPNAHAVQLPADVSILHVGTLGLVLEPMASSIETMVAGIGDDVLVLLDPNCRPSITPDRLGYLARLQRLLRRADVVKVSTDDLDFLVPDGSAAGVRWLLDHGATVVLHTDGGHSVHVHTATGHVEIAVPKVEIADTIGAGDAFGGAFAAWWEQAGLRRHDLGDGHALRAAVGAAVDVAAVNCTRVGAQPPRRAELGERWRPAR